MTTAVDVAVALWIATALAGLGAGVVMGALALRRRLRARLVAHWERDNVVAQAENVVRLGR